MTEYIMQINSLYYNKQCKYVKNKLLFIENHDITDKTIYTNEKHTAHTFYTK